MRPHRYAGRITRYGIAVLEGDERLAARLGGTEAAVRDPSGRRQRRRRRP